MYNFHIHNSWQRQTATLKFHHFKVCLLHLKEKLSVFFTTFSSFFLIIIIVHFDRTFISVLSFFWANQFQSYMLGKKCEWNLKHLHPVLLFCYFFLFLIVLFLTNSQQKALYKKNRYNKYKILHLCTINQIHFYITQASLIISGILDGPFQLKKHSE